jgi:hypothetical protein
MHKRYLPILYAGMHPLTLAEPVHTSVCPKLATSVKASSTHCENHIMVPVVVQVSGVGFVRASFTPVQLHTFTDLSVRKLGCIRCIPGRTCQRLAAPCPCTSADPLHHSQHDTCNTQHSTAQQDTAQHRAL